ncbi:uncharacterized protein LOC120326692 isoform X2 [Styela clava]
MWLKIFLCLVVIAGVFTSPHETGCGCTTTTTCNGSPNDGCEAVSRPGKRGPVGPQGSKGNKGEPRGIDQNRIRRLEKEIEDLKEFKDMADLYFSFPKTCAEYIAKETENRRFERVPIYPSTVNDRSIMMMANCTKLPVLINPRGSPALEVPINSLLGRTLILKATPTAGNNRFSVNFKTSLDLPRHYFHLVADMTGRYIARTDYVTKWNAEERDLSIPFPFKIGERFTMLITTDENGFNVELNGNKLLSFKHRQRPYSGIGLVVIWGLSVQYMSFN